MPTNPELMGALAQALQDASGAQQQLLQHLPTLMERADQMEADAMALRRMLWEHHGCGAGQQWQGRPPGGWLCLRCGADFAADSVAELRAKLALRPAGECAAPAAAPARSITVLGEQEQAHVAIPMDARWRPGKPDDWADVEPTEPTGGA